MQSGPLAILPSRNNGLHAAVVWSLPINIAKQLAALDKADIVNRINGVLSESPSESQIQSLLGTVLSENFQLPPILLQALGSPQVVCTGFFSTLFFTPLGTTSQRNHATFIREPERWFEFWKRSLLFSYYYLGEEGGGEEVDPRGSYLFIFVKINMFNSISVAPVYCKKKKQRWMYCFFFLSFSSSPTQEFSSANIRTRTVKCEPGNNRDSISDSVSLSSITVDF